MIYIGIDPGSSSGAISCLSEDYQPYMPPYEMGKGTIKDMYLYLKDISSMDQTQCVLERVNVHPNTAVNAASTFMKNVGHIEMALVSLDIPYVEPTPMRWMKHFGMKKDESESKTEWKRRLRELAEKRLGIKTKATTADAYLLALYGIETLNK